MAALNYCAGGTAARSTGARWNNKAKCPTCGKTVTVNKDGRLRAHGPRSTGSVYVQVAEKLEQERKSAVGAPAQDVAELRARKDRLARSAVPNSLTTTYSTLKDAKVKIRELADERSEQSKHTKTQRNARYYAGVANGLEQALSILDKIDDR